MVKKSKGVNQNMGEKEVEAVGGDTNIEFARVMFLKGFEMGRVRGVHQLAEKLGIKMEET